MKKIRPLNFSRRELITKVMPACAATCLLPGRAPGLIKPEEDELFQQVKHKFDTELERKMTYRQMLMLRYREFFLLAQTLEKELGRERAIEIIKNNTKDKMFAYGKSQASGKSDTSLSAYVDQFRDKNPAYKITLTKKVVEDTEKAFELKVTECIWASTFLSYKRGDIGFAAVCYGDYFWPQGFNPKIKMVRDKTLMQGHEYCNHRYIWTG